MGNVTLWTHGILPAISTSPFYGTFLYNYNPGDLLTYNYTGTNCCPAATDDIFIGAGQGFFVQMIDGPSATDTVSFDNLLRSSNYTNTIFYRNTIDSFTAIERHRIWLDLISSNSSTNRTLVGYIEGATMGVDQFFDANLQNSGSMAIYSLIGNDTFTIQGRALSFNSRDVIPLGVEIPLGGSYTIAIGAVDGLFSNESRAIYLEDTFTRKIQNLKVKPYTFTAASGVFNTRFKLRFRKTTSENEDREDRIAPILDENTVAVSAFDNAIFVKSSFENIEEITVFDLLGRQLHVAPKINATDFILHDVLSNQALIVKITLENGSTVIKKVLF
jgi:hypothetical protein